MLTRTTRTPTSQGKRGKMMVTMMVIDEIDNNDDEYSFDNDPREPDHDSEIDSRAFLQR